MKTTTWNLMGAAAFALSVFVAAGCGNGETCEETSDCAEGEVCTDGACTEEGAPGGPCTPGQVCRPSAGDCDVAETCPASGICPANTFVEAGTVCRNPTGPCDSDERCTGKSAQCPLDELRPQTTVCRSSAGACDPVEYCTGASAQCPPDDLAPMGTVCRPKDGLCDVAESCTGDNAQCPIDAYATAGTECRASEGDCDIAEACLGNSPNCPPDEVLPATTVCRDAVNACDVAEHCVGAPGAYTCPEDAFAAANTPCAGPTCVMGNFSPTRVCVGGEPTCAAVTPVSCNGYQCDASGTNCGTACGSDAHCLPSHYCQGNQCAPKRADGLACSGPQSGAECLAGVCTGSYVDADGDGFGVGALGYFCGIAPPAGRAAVANDCCDSDARAKPGQTAFFGTPRTGCGGFDFNCDGSQSIQFGGANACNSIGSCSTKDRECDGTTGWSGSVPGCGVTANYVTLCGSMSACAPSTCSSCTVCDATTENRTQACR